MVFPTILERTKSYLESRAIWTAAGKPIRSNERILEIYNNHCKECEHYKSTGYACDICGCFINTGTLANKIAWATTRCPDNESKWIEELDISQLEIKEDNTITGTEDISFVETPEPTPEPPVVDSTAPPPNGCGCG